MPRMRHEQKGLEQAGMLGFLESLHARIKSMDWVDFRSGEVLENGRALPGPYLLTCVGKS